MTEFDKENTAAPEQRQSVPQNGASPPNESSTGRTLEPPTVGTPVSSMRRETASPRRTMGPRGFLVGVLVVLTCLSGLASTVTIWAHQTVLNTDRFVATLKPVINDPAFINTVSTTVADQVVTELNVQQRVTQALPPQQAFLALPLTTAFTTATTRIANRVLSGDAFQRAWPVVLGKVHSQLVALLRGDTKNLVIENSQLKLNLFPVITRTLTRLQQAAPGLIKFKAPLPTDTEAKSPEVARQQLSQALGRTLPPTFGTVVLATSSQLDQAQQLVKAFDFLVIAVPVLTLVLAVLSLLLSLNRLRTLIELGIGMVVVFLVGFMLIEAAKDRIYAAVNNGTANELVREAVPKIMQSIENLSIFLAVVGVLVAIGAYLAGRPAWFMRLLGHFQHGTQPA